MVRLVNRSAFLLFRPRRSLSSLVVSVVVVAFAELGFLRYAIYAQAPFWQARKTFFFVDLARVFLSRSISLGLFRSDVLQIRLRHWRGRTSFCLRLFRNDIARSRPKTIWTPSLPTGAWLVLDLARVTWTGLAWLGSAWDSGSTCFRVFLLVLAPGHGLVSTLVSRCVNFLLDTLFSTPEESLCENMVTRPTTYDARTAHDHHTSVRVCALPISLYVVSIEAPFRSPSPYSPISIHLSTPPPFLSGADIQ